MAILFLIAEAEAQNVGIGTTLPQAKLHIAGGLLSDGTIGSTPVSGTGTRMMWIPAKGAFRSGFVFNTEWDDANIGMYSTAMGYGVKASGVISTAMGSNTTASNQYSIAMGNNTTASGITSTAMGYSTTASAAWSIAMGNNTTASENSSTAMGEATMSSGYASTAMGYLTIASGYFSTAMGAYTAASGEGSTSMGHSTKSKSFGGFVTGLYNDSTNAANPTGINSLNRIFQIGNGTADNARSNAMTVLQNGNVGIATTTPIALLQVKNGAVLFDGTTGTTPVSGTGTRMMWIPAKGAFRSGFVFNTEWDDANIGMYSTAMGYGVKASGVISTAMGSNTTASNQYSIAMGNNTTASGITSTAMGYSTTASAAWSIAMGNNTTASENSSTAMGEATMSSGYASTAMGYLTIASGYFSTAMGAYTAASGEGSTSMGHSTKSKSFGGFVTGLYNDSTNAANPTGINSLNRIFQIGNGTADNARSNAMTVLQNGNVGLGTTTPGFPLNFANSNGDKISLWGSSGNHYGLGIQANLLQIHSESIATDIAFGYGQSSSFTETMRIKGTGEGSIKGNLTVQNGKGIIRSNDGTQKKELSTTATVNTTITSWATAIISFTFPESFSAAPDVYVGNAVSGSGFAEVMMTVGNITTTGGTLYVHNPRTVSWSPNYIIKIIAIGPQ